MGIRFYCPNGHKLNVKDFQAGRNGICPFCGSKMQIPLESTRPSSHQRQSQSQEGGDEDPADSEATVDEVIETCVVYSSYEFEEEDYWYTADEMIQAGGKGFPIIRRRAVHRIERVSIQLQADRLQGARRQGAEKTPGIPLVRIVCTG